MKLHIAYIAGFLDADGTITCNMHKQTKSDSLWFKPQVEFANQDLEVLKSIRETLESGTIRAYKAGCSGCYRLQIPMRDAVRVLNILIPYLVTKKEQAKLLLKGLALKSSKGAGVRVPPEMTAKRCEINTQIHDMNKSNGKAYRTNWVNSVNPQSTLVIGHWAIPSQATEDKGSVEGVTTRRVSSNNNLAQECPAGNGRDSLNTPVMG